MNTSAEQRLAQLSTPARIAAEILAGFDRHYRLFRYVAQQAKSRFEHGQTTVLAQSARDRIAYYDDRVEECVRTIEQVFEQTKTLDALDEQLWRQIKAEYVPLLLDHKQPECAETFFNSVSCRVLHRDYFHNDCIFVRPAVATDYIDADPPSFRVYYPPQLSGGLRAALTLMLADFGLACPFVDVRRDVKRIVRVALRMRPGKFKIAPDFQVQVLSTLFFRSKAAYVIGKVINNNVPYPFAIPLLRNPQGRIYVDACLTQARELATLFSFTRAYFLVDMESPAAYVQFLRSLLPNKPKAELYTMLGLQKQGKTLFYRDFLHHLRHSHDQFIIAPGIKGLVMLVFTLPSYPYVFKVIKDRISKDNMDRHVVREKYTLVKLHDRVGRLADTWEYSQVALPKSRCTQELIDELFTLAPSITKVEGDTIIIDHVYIERRMTPLNIWLMQASDFELDRVVKEYGDAIKQLANANIFPGDMLYKNFGVTRLGRVVFYDYDEIQRMTEMNFRTIPPAPNEEAELSGEPWYAVGKNDVFPEEFGRFLLGNAQVKASFLKYHADLLTAQWWADAKRKIEQGQSPDVLAYEEKRRFPQG